MPRISQLPSLTAADNSDEIAIVDVSSSTTKKITRGDLLKAPLPNNAVTTAAVTDNAVTAPKIDFTTLSTTEKVVGKDDTGKDIFERVFNGTITAAATSRTITNISVSGIVQLIAFSGYFTAGSKKYLLGSNWGSSDNTGVTVSSGVYLDGSTLTLVTLVDAARSAEPYKLILRYTKA